MTQHPSHLSEERNAYQGSAASPSADMTADTFRDGVESEPTVYRMVIDAVEKNPLLALGAVAALGAITVMALSPRRAPEGKLSALERQARRQAAELDRTVRRGLNNSGLTRGFEEVSGALASRLASADLSALEPLGQRAKSLLDRALERVNTALR